MNNSKTTEHIKKTIKTKTQIKHTNTETTNTNKNKQQPTYQSKKT